MPEASGVIHDIGYQRYNGPRLSRRYSTWSIYVHSLRSAFGLGRTAKAKVLPAGMFALACLASLIIVIVSSQLPEPILTYVGLVSTFTYAITAFAAIVAPELASRDLRNSLLPLYFSRPPHRTNYALAKFGALATAVFVMFAGPLLIMFIGLAFSSGGIGDVVVELVDLAPGITAALIHAIVIAAIALPLASLTGRRVFATGMIIAVFLLSAPISGALQSFSSGDAAYLAGLLNPVNLLNGVDEWLFGTTEDLTLIGRYGSIYGVAALLIAVLGITLLMWRYKKVKA
ncbi:ABC transporter permease [Kibdelosporangium persicum]|uniref:ABC transporter permease n=1 Tax=Kibdelosporangium persicum TaxID=2698649 RepID=A0ABX2F0J5_9PSEU|nr:ABC transporter permease [Kibdelosporangium persicum]NRN64410.1 ABC transporter permease [Kibdelosporangium persicum]